MMRILSKIRSGFIYYVTMWLLKSKGRLKGNAIYLTFDDGPEPGITEFILDELAKYNAKATFFCVGKNIEKYPLLLNRIIEEGHSIGSHTFSHVNAFHLKTEQYISDIARFDSLIDTVLFRPPWGTLTLKELLSLINNKDIVLWHLSSNDHALAKFNLHRDLEYLKIKTKKGKIVLFHFCNKHAKETRLILPLYLDWLSINGYKALSL